MMKQKFMAALLYWGVGCGEAATPPITAPGQRIFVPSTESLVVQNEGGGYAPSTIDPALHCGKRQYQLSLPTRMLGFTRRGGESASPSQGLWGRRLLNSAELDELSQLLSALKVIRPNGFCAVDAPMLSLIVRTPFGDQKYIDDGSQGLSPELPLVERAAIERLLARCDELAAAPT